MAYRIRMSQQIFRACSVSFPHIYPPKKMGSMCTCHLCFGGRNSFLLHTCSCSPVSSLENIHIIPDHTSQFVLSQLVWAISCVFDDGVLIRASLRVRYLPNPLVVRPRPLISFEGQKYRHISYSDTHIPMTSLPFPGKRKVSAIEKSVRPWWCLRFHGRTIKKVGI